MSKEDYKTADGPRSSGGWRDYPDGAAPGGHGRKLKLGDHDAAGVKVGGRKDHEPPIVERVAPNGNLKPMRFVSLHHHTTFSYKDGYQLPEAHVRRATELNMNAIAFTEHGNISSHVRAEMAALEAGVKPIFGCEVYTGRVGDKAIQTKFHLTVLAQTVEGYKNLTRLVSRSWAEGFYYDPTVDRKMLMDHKPGLIVLSGCQGSLLFCAAVGGKTINDEDASYSRARRVVEMFKREFGDRYFIEVQAFPELEKTRAFNPIAERLSKECGVRLVATMDCHYTMVDDSEVQMILHNLRGGNKKTIEDQAREWGYDVPLCPPEDDKTIYRRLRETGLSKAAAVAAIVSTEEIAQSISVTLPRLDPVAFPLPQGFSTVQEAWEAWLKRGWRERGFNRLPADERETAKGQLRKEKAIMEEKGFTNYMMIVADAVQYIKGLGIFVGPARGSSSASIVCYLLGITEVNPLLFPNLVFERFIDVTREDLPDIDIDFPSEARPVLRDYLEGKYPSVSNVGTFTGFKGKNSLDDTARVFRVPKFEVDKVKNYLIERSSGDLRASSTIEDTVEQFPVAAEVFEKYPELAKARLLEGNYKDFGVHAGGLVIANEPIEDAGICAVHERELPKGSGNFVQAVGLDYRDAERQGLNKIDFLGLSTASAVEEGLRLLEMAPSDLYNLPLDDPAVIDVFHRNDVVGIFQMDGKACRYVCGTVKPDSIEEVMDIVALARPGALHNGAARDYAEIKHGRIEPTTRHSVVDGILGSTKQQIVYQEQILRIVREVGNFSWSSTGAVRKVIAKKEGEQAFSRSKEQFLLGALTLHERADCEPMDRAGATGIWGEMITAGAYSFNFAHSAAYGLLAYYTAWFKHYHPAIFYATSMNAMPHRQHDLLRDAGKHQVSVLRTDPARSETGWRPVGEKEMRPGFRQIAGVGEKTAAAIVEYRRENGGLKSWYDLINIPGIGPKTVEQIMEWADSEDPFDVLLLDRNIQSVKDEIASGDLEGLPTPTHTAVDLPFEAGREFSVVWIGTIIARNIRDIFETNRAKFGEELDRGSVRDPDLNEWAMLTCEDESDQLLVKIDRWRYPRYKEAIFGFDRGDLLLVEAVRPRYVTSRQIIVKKLWVITP